MRLKKANDMLRWPDAGTPSYIIALKWLEAYKRDVFFEACSLNSPPEPSDDHCTKRHPGKIANFDILD